MKNISSGIIYYTEKDIDEFRHNSKIGALPTTSIVKISPLPKRSSKSRSMTEAEQRIINNFIRNEIK